MKTLRGFTIIELVMVIVIVGFIFGLAGSMLATGFRSYFLSQNITTSASMSNIAMSNIMREIEGATSFSSIGSTSVTFVNALGNTITYSLSSTTLQRTDSSIGVTAQPVCTSVSATTFSYYTTALATTAVAANVAYVALQLTLTVGNNQTYTLMNGTLIQPIVRPPL